MVQDLILHLGDHKTGSTAIQATLKQQAYSLSQGSLHYSPNGLANNLLAEPMIGPKPDRAASDRLWAERARDLDASDARWGVLSAEHFEYVAPEELDRAIRRHLPRHRARLRLIAYVRPHAPRFLASFIERAKLGLDVVPMEAFLDQIGRGGMLAYAPRLARWKAVFGEGFHVRPFLRERLAGGDVVRDFLGFVTGSGTGSDAGFRLDRETRRNEALSLEDLALVLFLQRRIAAALAERPRLLRRVAHAVGWNLAPLLNAVPEARATAPRLHRSLAAEIVARYRADAVEVDRQWFDGAPLTAAIDRAEADTLAAPQSLAAEDHFSAAELRLIGVWSEMLIRLARADPEGFAAAIRAPTRPRAGAADPPEAAPD